MPSANLAGITIGGGAAWLQKDFEVGNPSSWDGIVIDPDGGLLGTDHVGLTIWENGVKRVQMLSEGIKIIGGSSIWVPENFDVDDPATWNGIVTDWTGIKAYHGSADPTVKIDAATGDFTLGKSTGPQLKYTASTGLFQVPAISTDILLAGSLASGSGILLDIAGIRGYKSSTQTFSIDAATGDFTFGTTAGKKLEFVASTGALTVGGSFIGTVATYLSTSQLAAGSNPATGVVIDNSGIRAYASSVQTFGLSSSGALVIGPAITSGSGVMIDPDGITNIAYKGITCWKSAVKRVQINEDGILVRAMSGGSIPFYVQSSDFVSTTTGSSFAFGLNAETGQTNSWIGAFKTGGSAWADLMLQSGGGGVCIGTTEAATGKLSVNSNTGNIGVAVFGNSNFSDSRKLGSAMLFVFGASSGYTDSYISAVGYPGGGASLAFKNLYLVGSTVCVGSGGTSSPLYVSGYIGATTLTGSGNRALYSDPNGWITNSSSDESLKTNIGDIPYGLDAVLKLRPIIFNWKQKGMMGDQAEIGFTAQGVESVMPELVGMNHDGMKSLDYAKMVAPLCLAIQELNAKLEAHINA